MRILLIASLTTLLLAGCSSLAVVTKLPTGEWSVMEGKNNRLRAKLSVTPVPLPQQITYSPFDTCVYRGLAVDLDGQPMEFEREVALRQVEDRLLIAYVDRGATSTALIDRRGKLIDFNTVQLDGFRSNAETFPPYAAAKSVALRRQPHVFAHAINELKLAYPHFDTGQRHVDSVVAVVTDEDDRPWAHFVYRGLTTHNGVTAAVLDLTKPDRMDVRGPRLTIGFSVVDITRGIPLIYVFDSGSVARLRVELAHCTR